MARVPLGVQGLERRIYGWVVIQNNQLQETLAVYRRRLIEAQHPCPHWIAVGNPPSFFNGDPVGRVVEECAEAHLCSLQCPLRRLRQ